MRLFSAGICTTVAVALLAGCSGMSQTTPPGSNAISQSDVKNMIHHHQRPVWRDPANLVNNDAVKPYFHATLAQLTPVRKASGLSKGMYVNMFYGNLIYAYQNRNTGNNPPACTISTGGSPYSYVNGIAVDYSGNLIAPIGFNYSGQHAVEIFQGPGMCGAQVGSFLDQYGQPSNAFATDAINGNILIANIFDNSGASGSLSICSLASNGCTVNLTNAAMYKVAGLAMNSAGDCWASAEDYSGVASLTWFQGCTGGGQQATGFMNTDYGGLMWDRSGNMVSVDKTGLQLWVYNGCNPACTVVGGPFPLKNECVSGSLNKQSMTFMCGAPLAGEVDVYAYTPSSLTFMYSYNNGLNVTGTVEGVAYNPAAHAP